MKDNKINGFVLYSDGHLKKFPWASRTDIHGDAYQALRRVEQTCVEHSLGLMCAGDLFDVAKPSPDAVLHFVRTADKLEAENLPIWYISGSHDREIAGTNWGEIHTHVTQVSGEVFSPWGTDYKLFGMRALGQEELGEVLADVPPEVSGLVLHQSYYDFLPFDNAWELNEEMLPGSVKHVWLGHLHDPTYHKVTDGGRFVCYGGCMYVLDIGESPERCVTVVLRKDADAEVLEHYSQYQVYEDDDVLVAKEPYVGRDLHYETIVKDDDVIRMKKDIASWRTHRLGTLDPIVHMTYTIKMAPVVEREIVPMLEQGFCAIHDVSNNPDVHIAVTRKKLVVADIGTIAHEFLHNERLERVMLDLLMTKSPAEVLSEYYDYLKNKDSKEEK